MSFFINKDSQFISWSNFLLYESFRPQEIAFGTNEKCNNKKFHSTDEIVFTFFTIFDYYFIVIFNREDSELGFGIAEEFSAVPSDFSEKRLKKMDSIQTPKIFSYILFVALEMFKQYRPDKIKFQATATTFDKYKLLVRNKTFLNILKDQGYEYLGNFDNFYCFEFIDDKSIDIH